MCGNPYERLGVFLRIYAYSISISPPPPAAPLLFAHAHPHPKRHLDGDDVLAVARKAFRRWTGRRARPEFVAGGA